MAITETVVERLRQQFPALARRIDGRAVAYFDGPAGTQVPQCVIDAVTHYFCHHNANHGGQFATSRDSDRMRDEAHRAMADLLGADDPDTVYFGPNMTTLTFALSRALARTWRAGDEIIVTRLDHDANISPWVLAAEERDVRVRYVEFHRHDCTLDLEDFHRKLTDRTRLLAVGCASNSVGTVNPVAEMCRAAREVGALSFLDAVHYAPHAAIDVRALGCDFLTCSAYKFFGPHVGVMWGRHELLEELSAYKLRPAPDSLPGKWMTGTQNHEGIAGVAAAVEYLAEIGRAQSLDAQLDRPAALAAAFAAIQPYERGIVSTLLAGLQENEAITVWGNSSPDDLESRLPTVSITHAALSAEDLATRLGDQGLFVWHGNYYALQVTETLGLEPHGMVRIGLVHYNTEAEVHRLLAALHELTP